MTIPGKIEPSIVAALIGAGVSLIVAIVAQVGNRRTSTRLATIEDERAERNARRDYEYEARKRLYEECEPLLFQAVELAETARSRILSLARTARHGWISADGSGWLEQPGYYFTSTAYLLFAPATTFRMLQSRLTVIDMNLERRLRTQYELLKLLFLSFNEDFELAECEVALPYEPDKTDTGEPRREELLASVPQQYARQGVYRAILDVVVSGLIVEDGDGPSRVSRCMTFGEFLGQWDLEGSELHKSRETLLELLGGFHPARKPVLWRVLVAQYLLYSALLRDDPLGAPLEPLSEEEMAILDWRCEAGEATEDEIRAPVRAAETYVRNRLADVAGRLAATEA